MIKIEVDKTYFGEKFGKTFRVHMANISQKYYI